MKNMEFHSVNRLNLRANLLSGNLLPITSDDSRFPIAWRIHSIFVWLMQIIYLFGLISGMILSPIDKAMKDGTIATVVFVEAIFMLSCLHTRRKLMVHVIQELNDILRVADETMMSIVNSTVKSMVIPFTIYGITGALSVGAWTLQPIALIYEKNTFFYIDYNLPTAFSSEPFSIYVLVISTVFMTVASVYLFLMKFGVDVYMIHLVLLMTAQYRYISTKLAILFRDVEHDHEKKQRRYESRTDWWMGKELRRLCRHQNIVMRMSFVLKKLLSLNFSLIYLNSVLRFCFIGIMLCAVPSMTFLEGISVVMFTSGSVMQFYLLCSSVQTLLDASTEMTDKAFHEGWYQFGSSVQRMFILMIMGNNIECKLAVFEKFNLSLPSFMTIMNQSYSIAILFLKAN